MVQGPVWGVTLQKWLIFSTIAKRYSFELREQAELKTREGFLRKPIRCMVGMRKRQEVNSNVYQTNPSKC